MRPSVVTLLRVILATAAIGLAQCKSDKAILAPDAPSIELSADARGFTATAGGANPSPQEVLITNGGSGTLSHLSANTAYKAGQVTGWLSLSLNPATAPATLEIMPNTGSLPPGTYDATVTIGSRDADSPRSIGVTFTVTEAAIPTIALSDINHQFSATAGGANPGAVSIEVTNSGTGTLSGLGVDIHHVVGEPVGWLTATLSQSTAPATLTLAATTGALAPGLYHAAVDIRSLVASNSPRRVVVTFLVGEPPPSPTIVLTPASRSFAAVQGGGNPATQTVEITNGGGGTLSGLQSLAVYQPGQPTGWLGATLNTTTAPATLTLTVTTGSLAAGTYNAGVVISSPVASNTPLGVTVTFTVAPSTPKIGLSATTVSFTASQGGASPATQILQLTNIGGGTLTGLGGSITYPAGGPTGWLSAGLGTTDAPTTLTLRATTGILTAGTYTATISITAPGASNTPQTVTVTFTVTAPNVSIVVTPAAVSFTAEAGAGNPAAKSVQITNGGAGTLSGLASTITYQPNQPGAWLQSTLSSTTAPATLTLTALTGALPAGSYNATIAIASPVAGNSPQNVTVTFSVTPATPSPEIGLSTSTRTFGATAGGGNPITQSLQVANTGGGALTGLQATENPSATWLTVSLSSTTGPATLTFLATTAGLAAGSYTTTVNVTSPVASNSPQGVTVTFNVQSVPPVLQTPIVAGTNVTLTWTFNWPGGLASSNDGYQLERSASPTTGFSQIHSVTTHDSPYSFTVPNLATGTHYFRVHGVTRLGATDYSNVQSAVVGGSAQITIVNQLSPGGSDKVMRFRLASTFALLRNAANTAAERLSPDSYCGGLPGVSIDPGESMTFTVSAFAPNYFVHIGLGDWDNSDGNGGSTCWHKKMWGADNDFNLLYLSVDVAVTGHTGPATWMLMTVGNNLVLRTPSGDIPVLVSVNQDPIQ